ncbi:MAG: TIM barrel protein [Anaerolineales bacterium]|nr:TIM barrel protein [Anaerolineales bacterium]
MEYTGYLDFWFRDRPIVERVEPMVQLGLRRLDVWFWRQQPMAAIAAECRRLGAVLNSAFDDDMGNLTDPGDNELTLRTWNESLEMAVQHGVEHLFLFSNQVDLVNGAPWIRRLSSNYTPAEQYANCLRQTERILKLVEQTPVTIWVEALNEFHIKGGILVHNHDLAADWVRRFNHPKLRLVFDCYHQQRDGGNLIWGLEQYAGLYDAVHVGDVPTRQEPGTGEINFPNLHRKLRELKYAGYVGLEFYPSTTEAEALERVKALFPC